MGVCTCRVLGFGVCARFYAFCVYIGGVVRAHVSATTATTTRARAALSRDDAAGRGGDDAIGGGVARVRLDVGGGGAGCADDDDEDDDDDDDEDGDGWGEASVVRGVRGGVVGGVGW